MSECECSWEQRFSVLGASGASEYVEGGYVDERALNFEIVVF